MERERPGQPIGHINGIRSADKGVSDASVSQSYAVVDVSPVRPSWHGKLLLLLLLLRLLPLGHYSKMTDYRSFSLNERTNVGGSRGPVQRRRLYTRTQCSVESAERE